MISSLCLHIWKYLNYVAHHCVPKYTDFVKQLVSNAFWMHKLKSRFSPSILKENYKLQSIKCL